MNALRDLQFFVRAARSTSFSEAARALDVTAAAASAAIKRLEDELGVKLFVRSTRSLRLTPEGEYFLSQCEPGLELITHAHESLAAGHNVVRGVVQLSAPSDLGRNLLLGWLCSFRLRYPDLRLRLQMSDRLAGLHREQVDVALRYGDPQDSSLVSLPVAPHNLRVLCAAPDYLARHGSPASPAELEQHNCLSFMLSERTHNRWHFTRDGESLKVEVRGSFQCDDGDAVRRLALLGEGIAYKSRLDVDDDLRAGRLVQLCPDWAGEAAPLHLVCAGRRHLRPAVRLLREFLVECCAQAGTPG